ncbi:sulfotransferase family 2 domain-containing protein [Mangrovimonas sp. AS39]|uniref:sulfotransferase family 2 domain-containing protein n=1 Tax=Mangrovimonas futianensis TaxID=2895523 RepID=UPI001E47FBDA|nr:sulfotransferase family 2 domain-containing protein [Mangrovimonas futianensis]MCF1191232.1 sulfotransferase family 2 domain-containing protein [Mangrovimonas futianensis]MCF1194927.1 sulfotransferase family 2 domain-containing protein [Mangrovimonas futianensis]
MIFFLHIPKTAGTTFYDLVKLNYNGLLKPKIDEKPSIYLKKQLDKCNTSAIRLPGDYFSSPKILDEISKLSFENKKRINFIGGHVGYGFHEKFELPLDYISFIREPQERLISDFYEHHKEGRYFYKELKACGFQFNAYLEILLKNNFDNWMTRMLSGPYNVFENTREPLKMLDFENAIINSKNVRFFNINDFEKSLIFFYQNYNWKKFKYTLRNKSLLEKRELTIDRELLNEALKYDRLLFKTIRQEKVEFTSLYKRLMYNLMKK